MKDFKLWTVLSHINLVLSIMFMTFFVIDRINPAMDFINSEISKWLLLAFALFALTQAIVAIVFTRKLRRHRYERYISEERRRKRSEIIGSISKAGETPAAEPYAADNAIGDAADAHIPTVATADEDASESEGILASVINRAKRAVAASRGEADGETAAHGEPPARERQNAYTPAQRYGIVGLDGKRATPRANDGAASPHNDVSPADRTSGGDNE